MREPENFTRSVLDSLSAHIAILDGEGVILAVNRAWRRFAEANQGQPDSVGEGANYLEVCDRAQGPEAESAHRVAEGIRGVMRGDRQEFLLEYPCHSPTEPRWFVARVTPFAGDGPLRAVVAHETITGRKLAEERLCASETRLREAQALAHLGNWELEFATDALSWSDEVFRIFEIDSTRFLGSYHGFLDLVHPDDRAQVDRIYAESVRNHTPYDLTHRLLLPDGRIKHVHERCVTHYDAEGNPLRSAGTVQDITEQRRGEEERAALERQLSQARKVEAMGRLAGGIAHDFNNILAAILGYTNLALDRYAEDPQGKLAQYLNRVIAVGERARDLVAQMLAYGRPQANPAAGPIWPAPVVREAAAMLAAALPDGIRLHTEFADETAAIRIDPGDLRQALMNLAINARDAQGDQGAIRIRLGRVNEPPQVCPQCQQPYAGEFVELRVEDDGPGIPADLLPRIFDPFVTTKGAGKGSGLGLAVVQGIALRWGGHVQARSNPGAGAVFRLLFPLADPPAPAAETASPHSGSAPGERAGARRIWVVDDEPMLADYLKELLEQHGYQVTAFTDPIAALEAFVDDPAAVDGVLSDQDMPDMGGLDLAEALHERRPNLPILLCSGRADAVDRRRAEAIGIRRVLAKPVDQAQLLTALREADLP